MILTFQIIRRVTRYWIGDQPILTLRMIMTVAMIINMFLLGCELFTEFYSPTRACGRRPLSLFRAARPRRACPVDLDRHRPGRDRAVPADHAAAAGTSPAERRLRRCFVGIWIERAWASSFRVCAHAAGTGRRVSAVVNETLVCLGIWAFGRADVLVDAPRGDPHHERLRCGRHALESCASTHHNQSQRHENLRSQQSSASIAVIAVAPWSLHAGSPSKKCRPRAKPARTATRRRAPPFTSQWGTSKHYRGNVGCFECHMALTKPTPTPTSTTAQMISTIVTPKDCGRCHEQEVGEFNSSHHAKGGRILGSLDNVLAEVVEGNRGFKTAAFPQGVSAAAVNGCWQCHGAEVKIAPSGKPDPATWPNTGIGRSTRTAAKDPAPPAMRGTTSRAAQARTPDTCGKCHMGPDHPQIEIYNESKHGIAYQANLDKMNLDNAKWIVGEDYSAAPTCATCHMSATKNQRVTHDVGLRISWNNRPEISVRPEVSDAKLSLPGKDVPWQKRRGNMVDVCLNCHNQNFVESFYQQYDGLIDLYHEKFAKPGLALYQAAKPLLRPAQFSNAIDFTWYEIWHHEGRRARHGVSMMGPDYTHWHGTYEVAKHFYSEYIPELQELVDHHKDVRRPGKKQPPEARAAARRDAQSRQPPVVSQQDESGGKGRPRTGAAGFPEAVFEMRSHRGM